MYYFEGYLERKLKLLQFVYFSVPVLNIRFCDGRITDEPHPVNLII